MDLHSPKIKGQATLDENATYDEAKNLVPREFVELKASGFVVVRDIVPSDESAGIVGVKEYKDKTIPAQFALDRCRTNTVDIRILIECEPDRSQLFDFGVTVNGQPAVLDAVPGNSRLYTGYCDISIDPDAEMVEVLVESATGQSYICEVIPEIGGPDVISAQVDALPAGQTHVKANDMIEVSAIVEDSAIDVRVEAGGASAGVVALDQVEAPELPDGQVKYAGQVRVSEITTDAPLTIIAKNFLGTETEIPFVTADVPIDQQAPVIPNPTYQYPAGQMAVKDGEIVMITSAITHADSVEYNAQVGFDIQDPTVLEDTKQVTLVTGEAASFDNDYYRITARKSTNGSATTKAFTIDIANAAPMINVAIVNNPARLRTDADGNDYKVRILSSQPLLEAPSMDLEAGVWKGDWVKKNDSQYERTITVKDSDPRGEHSFINLLATGRAAVTTNLFASGDKYTIAGFLMREVVVPALSQKVAIGTFVSNPNNIIAYYKDADRLAYQADLSDVRAGFSVVDADGTLNPNGDHLWISDKAFAGTNTSGTLTLTVEEQ